MPCDRTVALDGTTDGLPPDSSLRIPPRIPPQAQDEALRAELRAEVLSALAAAEAKPPPPLRTIFSDVYETVPAALEEQAAELQAHVQKYPGEYSDVGKSSSSQPDVELTTAT